MIYNVQNRSPSAAPAAASLASFWARIPHSHAGYWSSSSATGSCFPFVKFSPLSTVPAGTLLLTTCGGGDDFATGRSWFAADGDSGAEKGCAADVEVAAGGLCDDVGEPCLGAAELILLGETLARVRICGSLLVVEGYLRVAVSRIAARRQRLHIIVMVCERPGSVEEVECLCRGWMLEVVE